MRRGIVVTAACALAAVVSTPSAAIAAPGGDAADRAALAAGLQLADKARPGKKPVGPNPYLALLPDPGKADYASWATWAARQAKTRSAALAQHRPTVAAPPLVADEETPAGSRGGNDDPATGQRISDFGTGPGENPRLRILGTLSPEVVTPQTMAPNPEDDNAIPLAGDTGIGGTRDGVVTSAQIGDGPHGAAGTGTGDFDFYKVSGSAGETLTVDVDTPTGSLDSVVSLFDPQGRLLAVNDDTPGELDSLLSYKFDATGSYFVMVGGFRSRLVDPMDSASGDGANSEGPYDLTVTVGREDLDYFAVRLDKGDVLGASSNGAAAVLAIHDTTAREVHGSNQDGSALYPPSSPLPGGGRAVTEHVADSTGWYTLGVTNGAGFYDITVEVYRPYLQGRPPVQTLFLDFDGARVNTGIWNGPGVRQLSPMPAFLARWGLTRADEDAVIDAVVAEVAENVRQDLIDAGLNEHFELKILNSRDHDDPWGEPNVSRIIVGGTIAESGIETIGIAQTIDPGNFDTEETALVLLDILSDPSGPASLNTYLTADSDRVAFIGQAVGNIVAHEAGHFFGNWHVDQFNHHANLMDQGGNFPVLFGVGPDAVGGTADDPDVDFGADEFNPNERFTGVQNTLGRVVFGVTS